MVVRGHGMAERGFDGSVGKHDRHTSWKHSAYCSRYVKVDGRARRHGEKWETIRLTSRVIFAISRLHLLSASPSSVDYDHNYLSSWHSCSCHRNTFNMLPKAGPTKLSLPASSVRVALSVPALRVAMAQLAAAVEGPTFFLLRRSASDRAFGSV